MNLATKTLTAALFVVAGAAFAETEATDPIVIGHQDLMKSIAGASKVLGGMASGSTAYDAAAAEAAKALLIKDAADIAVKFKEPGSDPASGAKPEIWTNWEDFVVKANALGTAATALDVASADSIKAGMGAVGGACKDCHTTYRLSTN
ncbi:hypothetical protein GCM10010873_36830 [Cypionkella aquatica]|uniref:Cytochrome c556 n=1 Tax=Cypionkella aquatica TaxID=1756042 RepID=A0AA37TXQ8_9RHOB|nr:cytochrome c [Cypionkella aquatica]GLS88709.1 hypothetical protein GCM10010873_36830 [Cypionkella aquatica]